MPGGDRTGPAGYGPMTGRGFGFCAGANRPRYGAGFRTRSGFARRRGFSRGIGRGFWNNPLPSQTEKELLLEQKNFLQDQLDNIAKQLENM